MPEEVRNYRVGIFSGFCMVGIALLFDGAQALLSLIPIPGLFLIPWFMSAVAFITFFVWFKVQDVNYWDRNADVKILTILASVVAELVPFVNMIPAITFGVVALVIVSRMEDGESSLLKFAALRNKRLSVDQRSGAEAWAKERFRRDQESLAAERVTKANERAAGTKRAGRNIMEGWSPEDVNKEVAKRREERRRQSMPSQEAPLYDPREDPKTQEIPDQRKYPSRFDGK